MDGLEDQAELEFQSICQKLQNNSVVEIKHSSRDTLMARICQVLCDDTAPPMNVQVLVFRSGLSLTSLLLLQTVLKHEEQKHDAQQEQQQKEEEPNDNDNSLSSPRCPKLHTLEFVNLASLEQVQEAIQCCRIRSTISTLKLTSFLRTSIILQQQQAPNNLHVMVDIDPDRMRRPGRLLAELFASHLLSDPIPHLQHLMIHGYPLGSVGAQVLAPDVATNTTLQTLGLLDCDLRTDSANAVAAMMRGNKCLRVLDLSLNQFYLANALTWEMTVKTLIRKGLMYNTTLQDMPMDLAHAKNSSNPSSRTTGRGKSFVAPPQLPQRHKIDRHLALNRFCNRYFDQQNMNPMIVPLGAWPSILKRASIKPATLHRFVQDCAVAVFS